MTNYDSNQINQCIYVYFYNYDNNVDVYIYIYMLIFLMKLLYFLYAPQKAVRE